MRYLVLAAGLLLTAAAGGLGGCSEADREAMFSTERAPLAGACDPQPGYAPPAERPGCEYRQGAGSFRKH